jgi:DNA-binding transcriptional LysR family regulator
MFGIRDAEMVQEVARRGGFRAAAQSLGIAQSAVSARIALLERRLGIQVFDRSRRQVRLTAAGRRFLEEGARLVALRDRIAAELSADAPHLGTLRIGVAETIVHTLLPAMLRALHAAAPEMRLELSVETSPELARRLVEDELDLAVLMRRLAPAEAASTSVGSFALHWYASPALALPAGLLDPAALVRFPIITFSKGTLPHAEVERVFAAPDLPPPLLHGSASLSTILHLVQDGFGIGILPEALAADSVAAGRLRRLEISTDATLSALDFSLCHIGHLPRHLEEALIGAATDLSKR